MNKNPIGLNNKLLNLKNKHLGSVNGEQEGIRTPGLQLRRLLPYPD